MKTPKLMLSAMFIAFISTTCFAQNDAYLSDNANYQKIDVPVEGNTKDEWKTSPVQALSSATDTDNMAVIDGLYKAFANGDIPGALADMDPNIEWNEAESFPYADRNPYIGPDAVVEGVFARIGAEWEYWNLTDIELHEMANDKVLATLRYRAKYKKNSVVIDAQTAHFWTLKDGKITRFQQFTDTDQVVRAVAQ